MLKVADMGKMGVKNHWKRADVLYGWPQSLDILNIGTKSKINK